MAAKHGELDLVKAVIGAQLEDFDRLSPQKQGKSLIHAAICGRNTEVLEQILEKFCNLKDSTEQLNTYPSLINPIDQLYTHLVTPLSYAAYRGQVDMVSYMLEKSPSCAYKRGPNGLFPIHMAAGGGQTNVINEILKHGADSSELLSNEGENILHIAAKAGRENVAGYILNTPELGMLINERANFGNTPFTFGN